MTADMILEGMVVYRGTQTRIGWQRCGAAFLHICYEGALAVVADRLAHGWRCPVCGGHRVDVDSGEAACGVKISVRG